MHPTAAQAQRILLRAAENVGDELAEIFTLLFTLVLSLTLNHRLLDTLNL